MPCDRCEQEPCTCPGTSLSLDPWLMQHCSVPGCQVTIRLRASQQEAEPICKWHQAGTAYNMPNPWPPGMPNPEYPWPWLTDRERDIRVRLPYWQDRFRRHAAFYARWIIQPETKVIACLFSAALTLV